MTKAPIRPILATKSSSSALEPILLNEHDAGFNEAWLQDLIHNHPTCLPIEEIEPAFQNPVAVCKELPTKHGPIDNFLVTPEGNLVIAEVKLWRNPEARRKVVAQALDYASCLFEMDYADLEGAVLSAQRSARVQPRRLYDFLPDAEAQDEAAFVDAVTRNLQKGRALILVVGEGIREEVARLAALLQSHAGAHFTFALIEMNIFRMPQDEVFLVYPRTLLQTEMIQRGVIEIDDRRVRVKAPERVDTAPTRRTRESITAERFFESMAAIGANIPDRLRAFIAGLEPLNVQPEFRRSLIFRWEPPSGNPINLGYIALNGQVWTDASNWKAPHDITHLYNEELAQALDVEVNKSAGSGNWHIASEGRAPRIDRIVDMLDRWPPVIERFQQRLIARLSEEARNNGA